MSENDFNKFCEENYNNIIKKLLNDPLIKKMVKKCIQKESIKFLEDIKSSKQFLDLPIDEIVYYRKDGQIHGQIIYNIYSTLKILVNAVLELQESIK